MMNIKKIVFLFAFSIVLICGCAQKQEPMRFGSVIGIKAEAIPEYKELHAKAWPGILDKIGECNIRNYSIYLAQLQPSQYYLFSYCEYVGNDFDADMKKMADDPLSQQWWKHTDPLQTPLSTRAEGEWWHNMEEVFHYDGRK